MPVTFARVHIRFAAFVLVALAATGCGYQLRGAVALPSGLDAIHVAGPSEIRGALIEVLDGSGVQVQSTGDAAEAVVRLTDERFSRRVLSVDSESGKVREFELAYRVTFRVTDAGGEVVVPGESMSVRRTYVFDPTALLGKNREQRTLHAEMRRDAARQVARRIAAALGR